MNGAGCGLNHLFHRVIENMNAEHERADQLERRLKDFMTNVHVMAVQANDCTGQ